MYAYEYMQFVHFAHLERAVTVAVLGGGEQQGHQVCREMLDLPRVIHLQPNARAKIHVQPNARAKIHVQPNARAKIHVQPKWYQVHIILVFHSDTRASPELSYLL